MHIKAKLYPYPVLASFNNDYKESSFDIVVDEVVGEKEITLHFTPQLENIDIKQLILSGKAAFVIHIECPYTCYRQTVKVPFEGTKTIISASNLDTVVNICPFVVATEDIKEYRSELFDDEFEGISFDLERGSVLALGYERVIHIDKEDDNLASIPSIFSVTEIIDPKKEDMVLDCSGEKISIALPSKAFRKFVTQNNSNPNAQPVLHAMLIIPALTSCLDEVKYSEDDYYLYDNKRWFRAIQKAAKKLNINITEETIKTINTFDLAQKLMKNATINGIVNLDKVAHDGGDSYEN